MASALEHLQAMIALSRESWTFYKRESDDENEWIPNPSQKTVVPGVHVTDEMVRGWQEFLDEAEALLAGKTLVPFWRGSDRNVGINLRRVFTETQGFDPVLLVTRTE